MRLAIGLYYDGVETVNPIGAARGSLCSPYSLAILLYCIKRQSCCLMLLAAGNALGCFYVVLFNLDPAIRIALPYIIPVTIALENDMKHYGPCAIVSGANRAGT
eukprot:1261129-Pleurochrysis_carterae.AAC.1